MPAAAAPRGVGQLSGATLARTFARPNEIQGRCAIEHAFESYGKGEGALPNLHFEAEIDQVGRT